METPVKSVILLVDDQDTIRFFLEKTLKQEGYEAVTARTGAEAVAKAREVVPDLVLLDLKLPDMDGLEVLRRIKEIFPEIGIVMITAFGDVETAVTAMKTITATNAGSTSSGGTRMRLVLPENTGRRDTIRKAISSV